MLGVNNDTHRLLKRPSFRLSNIKERDKDKDNKDKDKEKDVGLDTEDSLNIFRDKKDEPTGGFINALTFGHTYTRKGGKFHYVQRRLKPFHAKKLFLYPLKTSGIIGVLMFSGGIKGNHWHEMSQTEKK